MQMIRHMVLINWKSAATQGQIDEWVQKVNRIPDECPMIYNWCSSHAIPEADLDNPSTHAFCITFDIRSPEEFAEYQRQPYPRAAKEDGMAIIDMERTASTNMWVEAEPLRVKSRILRGQTTA